MSDISERIASLPSEKRALLAIRLAKSEQPAIGSRQIPRREQAAFAPLSYTQQSVWFLEQLYPGNVAYNSPVAVRFSGRLDSEALEWSWNQIIRRHDLLRTVFELRNGDPVQYATQFQPIRLCKMGFDELPESERMEGARIEAVRLARQPFDLAAGQPWRAKLLCCSDREHILAVVLHHIVCDGWSIGILVRELVTGYEAFLRGETSLPPELPVQYADYAVWQRRQLISPKFCQQVELWRKRLEGFTGVLQIPPDKPRPAEATFRGARVFAQLPLPLTESLHRIARAEGATLFMVLLAAFKVLLARYGGQTDVVVGSPIANRERSDLEGLIGFFANTQALRTDLSGDPTFCELLARVREVTLKAYNSQEVPFEKLVEELKPERQLNRNPFFDISFGFQNLPMPVVNIPDLSVDLLRVDNQTSKFDLSVVIVETERGLTTTVEYSSDLFDASTPDRLLRNYRTLLEAIAEDPQQGISRFPLLTPSERNQMVVEWNDTERDFGRGQCIQELFEAQVERTPEAVAVVYEDQRLSYRELNGRANQLAHYLQKLGVGPEVLVGICVERSVEMIVAMLGILKAGGAYVPLEPNYPAARLAFMLEEGKVSLLIAQERTVPRFIEPLASVILIDRDWRDIARESAEDPHCVTKPANLAYVVYTSGSTGRPKGVAIEHRQLLNYLHGILERLKLPRNASFATVSTLAADLGNTVVFSSLCAGGTLHVISEERITDADALGDYFSRHAIDCLKIVPSHLAALQNGTRPSRLLPRKLLILGGEASRLDWIKSLLSLNPGCAILNHYGPTEATVGVLTYRVESDASLEGLSKLPMGRPLSNTRIYLLDQHLSPVPVGVAGELYIGGLSLARGYLNHPELTAERFVPNPFSKEAGARLYKSGDLARYLPDGNIEFLGRVDDQVKIRGFRIEPREIEAALEQHPGVMQAAVIAAQDQFGENRLVAHVVPKRDPALMIDAKRRYVLPNGMAVSHLNRNETDYLYDEIFKRQAYLRHGITIKDGDCIFDVGANIGLFLLFAHQICEQPKVYAFEPNPAASEILGVNASLHAPEARVFSCGLSDEQKTATFTFFPGFSLLSGFYADPLAEKELVRTYMTNQQKAGASEMADVIAHSDDLLDIRFSSQSFAAPLRSLSEVIEEERIDSIDLLKINVEKSELDVLRGIKEADWIKIKQIVLEADTKDNLQAITVLLEGHGYEIAIDQDGLLENTQLCYVYAIRPSSERRLLRGQGETAHIRPLPDLGDSFFSTANLRSFLQKRLPDYMVPSAFVVSEALPLNPNGKVDRRALPAPEREADSYRPPRTPQEEILCEIFADLLGVKRVGIADSFFELGGHSLRAMQLVSRVRSTFGVEIALRVVFEAPTVAELVDRVFRAEQAAAPLARQERPERLPLSFAQQRLWFLDRLESSGAEYNMREALRLRGELDVSALERAIQALVERHEILHTRFEEHEGEPYQIIEPDVRILLRMADLSGLKEDLRQEAIEAALRRQADEPFSLAQGPLLRIGLLKLGPQDHVLHWTCHHIVSDGWSAGVFSRELAILYASFSEGRPANLAELSIHYADYALWQRRQMEGGELHRLLEYWRSQLADLPAFELPADFPRPSYPNVDGGAQMRLLPPSLCKDLRSLSSSEGATMAMLLLAAFELLLGRLSGQDDVAVGLPIAGRSSIESERLVGLFVNTLVLRAKLDRRLTFRQLLAQVRKSSLEAYAHQDIPFEKLVEVLNPERVLNRHPLFEVLFNYVNVSRAPLDLPGLSIERLRQEAVHAKFPMTLYLEEMPEGVILRLVYQTALFLPERIEHIVDQFHCLLTQIAKSPDRPIQAYSLVTENAREWLPDPTISLGEPGQASVSCQFLSIAGRSPRETAVRQEGQRYTYEELATSATKIAKVLTARGVQPGDVVAVSGQISFGLISGILGVLMARGVLLMLDASLPRARRDLMLKIASAKHWLRVGVSENIREELSEDFRSLPLTQLSSQGDCIKAEVWMAPKADDAKPEDPAYIFFTSGTTGVPKGILGTHKALSHFIGWEQQALGVSSGDRVAQLTGLSFDVVLRDIFLPLTAGATLCLPDSPSASHENSILAWLLRERITILHTVPSLASAWLHGLESPLPLPDLHWVLFAGEPLSGTLVHRWRKIIGTAGGILNLYGPTEATLAKCAYHVPTNPSPGVQPIGGPLPNSQALVINQADQLCGIGEPGEIVIRTPFRTLGYLNGSPEARPNFTPNPFRADPADIVYRTGDIGWYDSRGLLRISGRLDDQVKIRGSRVEPAEISAALAKHPNIRQSAVIVYEDNGGEKVLVAYVLQEPKSTLRDLKEFRGFLKQSLPDYMIPAFFMRLDNLPLTANGKLDRKALPVPDMTRPQAPQGHVAPRDPTERALAGLWRELLKLDEVGIDEDFFELGGHSLTATRLVSRIRKEFEADIPLRAIFENPTIESLAIQIAKRRAESVASGDVEDMLRDLESLPEQPGEDEPIGREAGTSH